MRTRVLVIDDETNVRAMIRIALEADGYEVEEATDGTSGLDIYGDGSRFDVVVLDQKMPGIDGIEALKRIRRKNAAAAVVMATAYGTIELAVDAMKAGATDFLRKPLTPDILRGAVLAALGKRAPSAARPTGAPPPLLPATDVWTVNGYFIHGTPPGADTLPNEHTFSVRHAGKRPSGDVVVVIDSAEMDRISRLSRRHPPPGRPFWQTQAERALMNYLFTEAAIPPGGRLIVGQLSDETVLLARSWTGA